MDCRNCGRTMFRVVDKVTGLLSDNLWWCDCMPPNHVLAVIDVSTFTGIIGDASEKS